jgi:hypothetical protein
LWWCFWLPFFLHWFLLPPPLGLLLSIRLVLPSLHCILKLAIHIHLNHFHSFAISCVWFLPMNIGPLCLSLTNIMLGVINEPYSFDLLVWLATNCPFELATSCSRNLGQTFISLWHTLCIPAHYFSMPISFSKHCILHLLFSFVFDPLYASLMEF